jgi:hypothetical protein
MRVALVVGVALVAAACSSGPAAQVTGAPTSSSSAAASGDGGTTGTRPDAGATLDSVGLQPDDAATGYDYAPYQGGDQVRGQVSLDVCSQRFSSESLRVARHQVGIRDTKGKGVVSTEALLYRDPAAAAQAMGEIQQAVAACPSTPTKSAVAGAPALSYQVNAPPDEGWQRVAGVDRLAFDMTASDESGHTVRIVTIFLRRARLLLGIYLQQPEQASQALTNHPSVENLTSRFASEIAALPATDVQ